MEATSLINKFGGWTESYWFYVDSNNPIELRYDPKDHVYLLATDDGELEKQNGVTNVCHIIDKSGALVPWGCKMMAQKLITTAPYTGDGVVFTRAEFENFVLACKGAHKEKLEDAGAVGHIAHNWIEQYIKLTLVGDKEGRLAHRASLVELEERAQKACIAGLDWMKKHNVRWRATERKIYSRSRKYAGTMDGLCICDSCDDVKCCPNPFKDRLTIADWKTSNYLYMEYLFQTAAYQFAYQEEMNEVVEDRWIIRLGKEDGEFEAWHREAHNFDMDWRGFELALDLTRHVREVELNLQARSQALRAAIKAEKDAARATAKALEDEKKALAKVKREQARIERLEAVKEEKERIKAGKITAKLAAQKVKPVVKKAKTPDISGLMAIIAKPKNQLLLTDGQPYEREELLQV